MVSKSFNPPNEAVLVYLLIGIHLSALPNYINTPVTILLLILMLSLWKLYLIKNSKSNPRKLLQISIILIVCLTIFYAYGHLLGQQPGIALITLMTLLKLFETKKPRDAYIIICSAFFIIASNFFHSQSIWLLLYVFLVVIFLLTTMITLSDRLNTISITSRLKMATRFTAYAFPIMLILFVLFPRIPGPLWALPNDAFSSQTGLSEEMSPGSINNLISSSAIAFRVKFYGEPPAHHQRYWRGAVLSSYDGKTWRRDDAGIKALANITYPTDTLPLRYRVTLEPTNLNWLLSLEYPQTFDRQYRFTREVMLVNSRKINSAINYTIESQTSAINTALFPQESYKNRLLPVGYNPQTMSLARQLLSAANFNATHYVDKVLSYFRDNNFVYTLQPDLLGTNSIDDFLFQSRRGFCEHYASAFTYLMRAAGIPARVVVGYQGGKMNPLDDYMIVRQSDAHAWSEVWINDRWLRIDPTAVVSPERVEQGILNAGLETGRLPILLISDNSLLQNAAFLYDSFQNKWNQLVIGFDQQTQTDLLHALGFESYSASNLILLLTICLSVTALVITWLLLKQVAIEKDEVQHHFNHFCRKLQRHGITRQLNEGSVDFESRLLAMSEFSTQTKKEIRSILQSYRNLHYGNNNNALLLAKYSRQIKKFSVRKLRL